MNRKKSFLVLIFVICVAFCAVWAADAGGMIDALGGSEISGDNEELNDTQVFEPSEFGDNSELYADTEYAEADADTEIVTDVTVSFEYPTYFLEMATSLGDMSSDELNSVLTSFLYLRDVYNLTDEELDYIASLIINGANASDILDIAFFWTDTCEDISVIYPIYELKDEYDESIFWIEDGYNEVTGYTHGELNPDDLSYYMSQGISIDDVNTANILCRKGVYTITEILDNVVSGESIADIANQINGTSISVPVSINREDATAHSSVYVAVMYGTELAGLEGADENTAVQEIVSDENYYDYINEARNEKYAALTRQLVSDGIVKGHIDESLGVVFDD